MVSTADVEPGVAAVVPVVVVTSVGVPKIPVELARSGAKGCSFFYRSGAK